MADTSWATGLLDLLFEVPAVFDPKQKVHFASGVEPASYSTYFVTPSLRANAFAGTAVSPWISIGGGFGHFGVADHLEFGGSNPGNGSNTGVFQMGLGLDVRVPIRSACVAKCEISGREGPTSTSTLTKAASITSFVGGGVIWRFGKS